MLILTFVHCSLTLRQTAVPQTTVLKIKEHNVS